MITKIQVESLLDDLEEIYCSAKYFLKEKLARIKLGTECSIDDDEEECIYQINDRLPRLVEYFKNK